MQYRQYRIAGVPFVRKGIFRCIIAENKVKFLMNVFRNFTFFLLSFSRNVRRGVRRKSASFCEYAFALKEREKEDG